MRPFILVVFMFMSFTLAGCSSSGNGRLAGLTNQEQQSQEREAAASESYDKAMQLYHNGEYLDEDAAFEYLNEAVELDPTLTQARQKRIMLLMERKEFQRAAGDVQILLQQKPDDVQAHFSEGVIKYQQRDWKGAIYAFSEVIKRNDAVSEAYAMRGACYMHLNRYEDSIPDFSQTIAFNPAHREAYFNRGVANMKLGYNVRAIHDLTQAFSLDSQSLDAIMTRASIYMSLKQYPRAVDDYERAAILSPTDSAVQALLAEAHAGSGDFADAIEAARRAHALSEAEGDAKASKVYLELIDDYRARKAAAPVKPSSSEVIEPKGDGSKGVPESYDPIHDREDPDGPPPDGPKPSRSQSS